MSRLTEHSHELIPYLVSAVYVLISLIASGHAHLTKCEPRAAVTWIGLIWLSPLVGIAFYTLLGINRIHRRARIHGAGRVVAGTPSHLPSSAELLCRMLPERKEYLTDLERMLGDMTGRPLLAGNEVEPLEDGDRAYPVMIGGDRRGRRFRVPGHLYLQQ